MCGIAGIISESVTEKKVILSRMVESLSHRGPDDMGFYISDNCGFGHTRLSIVDLSDGQQPMSNQTNDLTIVFNGEIYGFNDIVNRGSDYNFQTKSDTEVILYLYEKYGLSFLRHLPGMFSFAIWNSKENELLCARDRFGEKPFYYSILNNEDIIFASEIKSILDSGMIDPVIDSYAISHYLQKLYINPFQTIYKNINVLPAAHYLLYKNGKYKIYNYWNLPDTNHNIKFGEASEELKRLLKKSIERQLVADVSIGAFLSGGVDSTTVVGIASHFNPDIQTFSFSFDEKDNELIYSRLASKTFGVKNSEIININYDLADCLLSVIDKIDEPLADSSIIPTYLISKYASQFMKVILTGDGGDELLGGYTWYQELLKRNWFRGNNVKKNAFVEINKIAQSYLGKTIHSLKLSVDEFNSYTDNHHILYAHNKQYLFFSDAEIQAFGLVPYDYKFDNIKVSGTVDDALRYDIINYLPGNILTKIDRMSMANGLELRSPFLDKDLAEFCISLPLSFKVMENENKILLKHAFRDLIPDPILNRAKRGFGAPVNEWLKIKKIQDLKFEYLLNPNRKIYQYLSYSQCNKYFSSDTYQTWILLFLSIWLEKTKLKYLH